MKHFLIKYRFKDGSEACSEANWREHIGRFIAAVEADAILERADLVPVHESRQRVRRVLPSRRHD